MNWIARVFLNGSSEKADHGKPESLWSAFALKPTEILDPRIIRELDESGFMAHHYDSEERYTTSLSRIRSMIGFCLRSLHKDLNYRLFYSVLTVERSVHYKSNRPE
jgi:hypothetical protein